MSISSFFRSFFIKDKSRPYFKPFKVHVKAHDVYIYSDKGLFPKEHIANYPHLEGKPAYRFPDSGDIHIECDLQDDGLINIPDLIFGHEEQHGLHDIDKRVAHPHKDMD